MSEISALAAANFLNQATLPLIQASTNIPQIQATPASSPIQDRVSISPKAQAHLTQQ